MGWTPQQQTAIDKRGRSLIVSAAAGSGKTAVLVERLLQILKDPKNQVPAESIIVVTFTNDAAAQMKQRLTNALTDELSGMSQEDDPEAYKWLSDQRVALSAAKIRTINSFCFDLIRENTDSFPEGTFPADENGEPLTLSPLFTIADEGQEGIYSQTVLARIMERNAADHPEMMQLLYDTLCSNSDTQIEKLILSIARYLGSAAFPEQWMRDAKKAAVSSEKLLQSIRELVCQSLGELKAYIASAMPAAERCITDPAAPNRYVGKVNNDIGVIDTAIQFIREKPLEVLCKTDFKKEYTFQTVRKSKKDPIDPIMLAAFEQCKDICLEKRKQIFEQLNGFLKYFETDTRRASKVLMPLLELTEEYRRELLAEKLRESALSFPDAEELTMRLLASVDADGNITRTPLAEQLSNECSLIMVDEYQDTNDKQDSIFKLLSHNCRIEGKSLFYGDNAFLVGDVKQSIYAFRQANPENFRRIIDESTPISECIENDKKLGLIYLNQNFRSAPKVLDFVNSLFSVIMTAQCGEVNYNEHEQLNFGAKVYKTFSEKTTVLYAKPGGNMPAGVNLQAECIADTIKQMIGSTEVLYLEKTEKDGQTAEEIRTRPAEPGDFCILLRTTTKMPEFLEALSRRGVAVSADNDTKLLDREEIRLIRNLLRVTDNVMNDAAMAAVLLSPIYGMTSDDLARIKLASPARRIYMQMDAIVNPRRDAPPLSIEIPETLAERIRKVLYELKNMRDTVEQLPLEEAIWEIYELCDLIALQSVHDDAAVRRSNLEAFARFAADYREHTGLSTENCLSGWLRSLDRMEENGSDLKLPAVSVPNCVHIKTIHKSKGLQFKFVFAAGMQRSLHQKDSRSLPRLLADKNGLIGTQVFDKEQQLKAFDTAYQTLEALSSRREQSEEMRLLYVALTRAEQQLFLVMSQPSSSRTKAPAVCVPHLFLQEVPNAAAAYAPLAGTMQEWVMSAIISGGDYDAFCKAANGIDASGTLADYRAWTYEHCDAQEEKTADKVQKYAPDPAVTKTMRKQLAMHFATEASGLPRKVTVTALSHEKQTGLDRLRTPSFFLAKDSADYQKLLGNQRGTAVHRIMELIDFSNAPADAKAYLDALRDEKKISDAEYASLEPKKLQAFLDSDICRRIKVSAEVRQEQDIYVKLSELRVNAALSEKLCSYLHSSGNLIGTMDLIFREDDGWVIVDYKTDYVRSAGELREKYAAQLQLYAAAARCILGEDTVIKGLYLYSFTLDTAIEVSE